MLLASYKSTRPGIQGVANRIIRWRLKGPYSHSEIVFEPGDDVGAWMPDGTCQPDANGALWCVSSVAGERLPAWSDRRAGALGGVRFKRITLDPSRWDLVPVQADPLKAASLARLIEGAMYDWQQVAGYLSWLIPDKADRWSCAEVCAYLMCIPDAWRFDPCVLHATTLSKR
jgi:hypothetical protein